MNLPAVLKSGILAARNTLQGRQANSRQESGAPF